MMKRRSGLSTIKFVKNNKKKVFIVVISLTICIMCMYIVNFMLQSIKESGKPICENIPRKVIYARLSNKTLGVSTQGMTEEEATEAIRNKREEFIKKLESVDSIRNVYYTQCLNGVIRNVVGEYWYNQPLLDVEEIPDYLDFIGAKLISGRLPQTDGEIVLDSVVMKNNGYQVGDYYLKDVWDEGFKIVGELESDSYALCGTANGFMNSGWYFVIEHDGSIQDLYKVLEKIGVNTCEDDVIEDAIHVKQDYDREVGNIIDSIVDYMFLGVAILVAFAILILFISFIRERQNELCLYRSIGFSRGDIYILMMKELGFMFGLSVVLSVIATYGMMVFMKAVMFVPRGLICAYYYPDSIIAIIAMLVLILGILQLPVIYTISRIRTVDKMED